MSTVTPTISLNIAEVDYTQFVTPINIDYVRNMYDIIIVGSGLSGSSMAYHYRQLHPHSKILVIDERNGPAQGASSRNTGVLFAQPDDSFQIECVDLLLALIQNNNLDVDLVRKDYANLFLDDDAFQTAKNEYNTLSEAGKARTTIWDANTVVQQLNMNPNRFVGALAYESYQFNPYKLTLEILKLSGADVVVNATVLQLNDKDIQLEGCSLIRAKRVVDCRGSNGDDPNLIPIRLQLISSQPMTSFLSHSFYSPEGFGVQRPDGRVIFGGFSNVIEGGGFYENDDTVLDPLLGDALRTGFANYFNIAETFQIEHEWTGIIAYLPTGPQADSTHLFGFSGAGLSRIFLLAKNIINEKN